MILLEPEVVFRVGEAFSELDRLLEGCGCQSAAFITAWNPYSIPKSDAENHQAQRRLIGDLDALGARVIPGCGRDATGEWPPEDSVLALGFNLEDSMDFGRRFGQNAIVFIEANKEPRLILLR